MARGAFPEGALAEETVPAAARKASRFSPGYKLAWGAAAFGTAFISGTYSALLPIFYQDYLGLQARWIGVASLVYAVWNAVNDPLFGYVSDCTRTPLGRRIPYMRYTAPFLALTFVLVWFAPAGSGQSTIFAWMLATMLLYDTCYTMIGLSYSSLLPEITESDAERNALQVPYALFGLLGTLAGFLIPDLFRPKGDGMPSLWPLQASMIAVALISATAIVITTLRVKERREFTCVDKPVKLGSALRLTFTSRAFLVLVAENFTVVLMTSLLLGGVFYMADYVLHMRATVLMACIFVPLIAGVPLSTVLRRRFGVVGAQQVCLVLAGGALVLLTVAPRALAPLFLALAGLGLAGPQTLTNVLFAQVVDEDELRSGVRREGAFFGVNALLTKPAQSAALALSPFILEISHFVTRGQNLGQIYRDQPAGALLGIRALVGLLPGLAIILGAVILIWYPLRGERLVQMQRDLLVLHERKSDDLRRMDKNTNEPDWETS